MKPTDFEQLLKLFPTNEACFLYLVDLKYPNHSMKRVKGRTCFYTKDGKFVYPLQGTIFQRSHLPLTKWFYAIFLFANSKNGISCKEVERQLGIGHRAAWRMCLRIRSLMKQDEGIKLSGIVEADETYIGGRSRLDSWRKPKIAVVGMVEREGRVVAKVLSDRSEFEIAPFVERHLNKGSTLHTDGAPVYNTLQGYDHHKVIHSNREYVRGDVYTNNIEGFWSRLKGGLKGTHKSVSPRHLQSYVDFHVFHYNHRKDDVFKKLIERI